MQSVNTLRDEAETLPTLDEFDGLSIVEIAQNIINWPEGSEEQARAIAAIRARAPGIGHNRPPLAEQLTIDLAAFDGEVDAILDRVSKSLIVDVESAGKVNDLMRIVIDKRKAIDDARKAKNEPYAKAVGMINDRHNALVAKLNIAHVGADQRGGLRAMITAWDDQERAKAEAAQRKAREEQEAREKAAREAQAKADEARQQGDHGAAISADLQAASLQDQAERAATRASAIRPEPVRSHLGSTSRSRVITFTIDDITKAMRWALSTPGMKENVIEDLRVRVGAYLRSKAIGVAAVERGVAIPGITAKTELGAVNSRR